MLTPIIGKDRIFRYSNVRNSSSKLTRSFACGLEMSKDHSHAKSDHHHQHAAKRGIHRDWRLWAVVLAMLLAMGIYVVTVDEAVAPGVAPAPEVPAAAQ